MHGVALFAQVAQKTAYEPGKQSGHKDGLCRKCNLCNTVYYII